MSMAIYSRDYMHMAFDDYLLISCIPTNIITSSVVAMMRTESFGGLLIRH